MRKPLSTIISSICLAGLVASPLAFAKNLDEITMEVTSEDGDRNYRHIDLPSQEDMAAKRAEWEAKKKERSAEAKSYRAECDAVTAE